jgi:hypothetical protein
MPDGKTTVVMFPRDQADGVTVRYALQASALLWPAYVQRTGSED